MKLELVKSSDPVLHTPARKFDFENPEYDPVELAQALAKKMIEMGGVGIAAPQVGIDLQVFVFGHPDEKESITAFFNPKIVDASENLVSMTEGCLSYPKLYISIKRPDNIRIRFTDMHGETDTKIYSGFTARLIQHEYDHLQGRVFTQLASKYNLDKARREQKKLVRKET